MSDFLDINGLNVPVLDDSASAPAPIDVGDSARTLTGALAKTRIALKQQYAFSLGPVSASDALAWKYLIEGYGHHWAFDTATGFFSGKGLGPFTSGGCQVNGAGGKYGGDVQIDNAGTGNALQYFPTGLDQPTAWTVLCWIRAQDGSTWNHYLIDSTGTVWKNGIAASADSDSNCVTVLSQQDLFLVGYGYKINGGVSVPVWQANHTYAANALVQPTANNGRFYKTNGGTSGATQPTPWPTTLGGTIGDNGMTWTDQGPLALFVDDLVILPFVVPSAWRNPLYTFMAGQTYPDQPALYVSGLAPLNPGNMIGHVGETKFKQGLIGGAFATNMQTIEFTLEEA